MLLNRKWIGGMYSISRLERVCGPREQACVPGRPPPRNPAACHDPLSSSASSGRRPTASRAPPRRGRPPV